jgi:hypothetical protein
MRVTALAQTMRQAKTWIVKYNFRVFQPKWIGDFPRTYGPHNEGVEVEAPSAEEAVKLFAKNPQKYSPQAGKAALNPAYIMAVPK